MAQYTKEQMEFIRAVAKDPREIGLVPSLCRGTGTRCSECMCYEPQQSPCKENAQVILTRISGSRKARSFGSIKKQALFASRNIGDGAQKFVDGYIAGAKYMARKMRNT